MEDELESNRRRDPRYVERSRDLSDWIQVKVAKQFGEQFQINGLLWDLTPRAVKIALPNDTIIENGCDPDKELPLAVGERALLTFRFRNLTSTTAQATVKRIDKLASTNAYGVVLFFDHLRDKDHRMIEEICLAYHRGEKSEEPYPESAPSPSA